MAVDGMGKNMATSAEMISDQIVEQATGLKVLRIGAFLVAWCGWLRRLSPIVTAH
jgi:hypothetical protein